MKCIRKVSAWREFTGEDCAGQVREAVWAARDRLEAE
jgi:hypothetical protein